MNFDDEGLQNAIKSLVPDADFSVNRSGELEWRDSRDKPSDAEITDEAERLQAASSAKRERERLDAMTASRFQAKAAMDDAGLLDQVEDYMAGDDVPRRVKLAWEEASFRRGSKMVNDIGAELGLSESEIDELFKVAREIEA